MDLEKPTSNLKSQVIFSHLSSRFFNVSSDVFLVKYKKICIFAANSFGQFYLQMAKN